MEVLWRRGSATVAEVAEALAGQEGSAYNTILTMMRILHEKGYLTTSKVGRAHVYSPQVNRETAARKAVRHLLGKFFDDSPGELVLNFLQNEDLTSEDLNELKRKILESEISEEDQ